MARLRAVVVIHAPGLSGTPRAGHVSRALMKASWTASSARSKSPVTRISVATARPCSSRKTRSTMSWAALDPVKEPVRCGLRPSVARGCADRIAGAGDRAVIPDRADLEAADLRTRDHRGVGDRLVEVGRFHEIEAAERLLRLGERPI